MAIGTFANLAPAQAELARRQAADVGILNSTIAGLQQGNQLANLPQTLQDQRDMQILNQLQKQLAVQTAQQKLYDMQNPDEAIARQIGKELQIKAALNPDLGIVQAPQGLTGVTIQTPGALTQEQMTRLTDNDALGISIAQPTAAAGLDITPIMDTGLNLDRNIANAAEARKNAAKIAQIEARAEASGVSGRAFTDENGNVSFIPTRQFGGVTPTAEPVLKNDGTQLKGKITASKTSGGLTANNRQIILGRAAFERVDLQDPKFTDENGELDIEAINIQAKENERVRKDSERASKSQGFSTKQQDELGAIYLVQDQLSTLKDVVSNVKNTTGEPGWMQNALAVVATNPSDSIWSSAARQMAEWGLNDGTRMKEDIRGTVTSAIQSAISGKVITKLEATQLGFTPKADDTLARLAQKGAALEKYLKNKENSIFKASGQAPTSPVTPATTPTDSLGLFQ